MNPNDSLSDLIAGAAKKSGENSSRLSRWKPAIRWMVVLIVLVFLGLTIQRAVRDIQANQDQLDFSRIRFVPILAGIGFYMLGLFPAAISWLQTLSSFNQKVPVKHALDAYFVGHLGKYVPGKAMVIILRAGKLMPHGVELKPTIVSIFVETLTSLATGAVLGYTLILFLKPPDWMFWSALLCIPAAMMFLVPHTFKSVLTILAKSRIGKMPRRVSEAFTWKMMARTCAWMALGWVLHGLATWSILNGIYPNDSANAIRSLPICIASNALGAVAGFASMLPGGAVVRELVNTWLLSSIVPQPVALIASVAFRVCNLLAELIVIGSIHGIARRARTNSTNSA
jgi:glycosyltransferase 2 family protein